MKIPKHIREAVRFRANCACEFCGVTETDVGGLLTIDHYQPRTKGGKDVLENLLYCCPICNQFKYNCFPEKNTDSFLWNPRVEPASTHFLELEDGTLHPITDVGIFTLRRLRLNRPQLVAHRLKRRDHEILRQLWRRFQDLNAMIEQGNILLTNRNEEQQRLLQTQLMALQLLLGKLKD